MEYDNDMNLPPLDVAYLLAALVKESGGLLTVSTDWFLSEENPFEGERIKIDVVDDTIEIRVEGEEE